MVINHSISQQYSISRVILDSISIIIKPSCWPALSLAVAHHQSHWIIDDIETNTRPVLLEATKQLPTQGDEGDNPFLLGHHHR